MNGNLIEKIESQDQLFALVIRNGYRPAGIEFLGSPDLNQQIGIMSHPAGHIIKRHIHKPVKREISGTSEAILIVEGIVEAEIYDNERNPIKNTVLKKGDIIFLISGGHGFTVSKDAVMFEVKQGPYLGMDDKERF